MLVQGRPFTFHQSPFTLFALPFAPLRLRVRFSFASIRGFYSRPFAVKIESNGT
jgi:hypothetical protein